MYYLKTGGWIRCFDRAEEAWNNSHLQVRVKGTGLPQTLKGFKEALDAGKVLKYYAITAGYDTILREVYNAPVTDEQLIKLHERFNNEGSVYGFPVNTSMRHLQSISPIDRALWLYFIEKDGRL
jgi:hypothetical protein